MLITYSDGDDVLVTTPEMELETVREYFTEGGRDMEEWVRETFTETLEISSHVRFD